MVVLDDPAVRSMQPNDPVTSGTPSGASGGKIDPARRFAGSGRRRGTLVFGQSNDFVLDGEFRALQPCDRHRVGQWPIGFFEESLFESCVLDLARKSVG